MKKYLLRFLVLVVGLLGLVWKSDGQNLVPNPSFEDTVSCPNDLSEIDRAVGWSSYGISPDYFNTCASANGPGGAGIPDNSWGSQWPYNGNAYAGLGTFLGYPPNAREFMGIALSQPLTIGVTYFVSAYISKADNVDQGGATNNFGFTFFTVQYSYWNPAPVNNFSHVHSDSILTDATNWTRISGSFIADQAYQYLCLGNFYNDAETDTSNVTFQALYYVDEVCVSTDSLTCLIATGISQRNEKLALIISPNPFTTQLQIQYAITQPAELMVYDALGRRVKSCTLPSSQKTVELSLR